MPDDYHAMARVLREFNRAPRGTSILREELPVTTLLSVAVTEATAEALERRGWAVGGPRNIRLVGDALDYAGKNAAQLLALDFVSSLVRTNTRAFSVEDELPAEFRGVDPDLIQLALEDLHNAGAVRAIKNRGRIDHVTIEPALKMYSFGAGVPTAPVHVQQHVGPVIGGDQIVNSGGGPIVMGDHASVTINAGASEFLGEYIESMRAQGEVTAAALDLLRAAARPELNKHEVVGRVTEAASAAPRLREKLKEWVKTVPGHLAKSAIVEGIKLYLHSQGVLP